jgi:hypothetical protein
LRQIGGSEADASNARLHYPRPPSTLPPFQCFPTLDALRAHFVSSHRAALAELTEEICDEENCDEAPSSEVLGEIDLGRGGPLSLAPRT